MGLASLPISILVLAAVPAIQVGPPAPPSAPVLAVADAVGLPTPTEEAWGDEWFDDEARRAGALEQQRILAAEAAALSRAREEAAARAAAAAAAAAAERASRVPHARPILPPDVTFGDLDRAWLERREALLRQDRPAATKALDRLQELRGQLDVPEIHAFAGAAIRESRALEGVSDADAVARAELAVELGFSLPAAHFQLARARFLAAPGEIGAWSGPISNGFQVITREARWRGPILADLAFAGLAGLLLAGAAVLLLLLVRYGRPILHDFRRLFPRSATWAQTTALAALLVVAPAVLGLGPLGVAAVLSLVLWLWLGTAERVVVATFLVVLGLAPLAAGRIGGLVAWSTADEGVWALERAGDFSRLPALARRANLPDATPQVLFAVARAEKRTGDIGTAAALYERALAARPSWPEAMVNLGNIRLVQGRDDEAVSLYVRANTIRPTLAAAHFNLSRLLYRRLDLAAGQEARTRAVELDRTLVERYAAGEREDASPRANLYLLDAPLPPEAMTGTWAGADEDLLVAEVAQLLHGRLPLPVGLWVVGGLLAILAALSLFAPRLGPPRTYTAHGWWAARRRRVMRILSFVLVSHVVSGRVVRGAVLLAVVAVLAVLLLAPVGLVRQIEGGPPAALRIVFAAPALIAIWALGVRDAFVREE